MVRLLRVCAVTGVLGLYAAVALAAPGDLDPSFGGGSGVVMTVLSPGDNDTYASAVTIEPDGKVVLAASDTANWFDIIRYKDNGTLDSSFGGDGIVRKRHGTSARPTSTSECQAQAVALQPDGKIVGAGYCRYSTHPHHTTWALFRFQANGTLDPAFGGDGRVLTNLTRWREAAQALVVQPNGKIVVAGWARYWRGSSQPFKMAVARYNPNGTRDRTFSEDGIAFPIPASASANDLAVQADGKFIVAGAVNPQSDSSSGILVRLSRSGSLDPTFGSDGRVDWADAHEAFALAIQTDGRIVAVDDYRSAFALARFAPDGSLDTSFGDSGQVVTQFGGVDAASNDVVPQPDGKIVVAGWTMPSSDSSQFVLARYETDGSLDPNFGRGGTVARDDIPFAMPFATGLALQADGNIVVVGGGLRPHLSVFEVVCARYLSG